MLTAWCSLRSCFAAGTARMFPDWLFPSILDKSMMWNSQYRALALAGILVLSATAIALGQRKAQPRGHVREYYIAAEHVEWDFAPSGLELMHGQEVPYPWGLHRHATKTRYTE